MVQTRRTGRVDRAPRAAAPGRPWTSRPPRDRWSSAGRAAATGRRCCACAAPLGAAAAWFEAQRLVAEAQWRNENSVQNLAGLQQVVDAYEAMEAELASATCAGSCTTCRP